MYLIPFFSCKKQQSKTQQIYFTRSHLDNISFIDNNCRQRKMELELGTQDLHRTEELVI